MPEPLPRERLDLLKELQPLIAVCYNPHSTRAEFVGPDDWDIAEIGREFQYPLTYGEPGNLSTAHYKFGANELYVMQNLNRVLDYLEEHPAALPRRPKWSVGFRPAGVRVGRVLKGRPAWKAGLRDNDIIVRANDSDVGDLSEFEDLRNRVVPGGDFHITVLRHGRRRLLTITRPKSRSPGRRGRKR